MLFSMTPQVSVSSQPQRSVEHRRSFKCLHCDCLVHLVSRRGVFNSSMRWFDGSNICTHPDFQWHHRCRCCRIFSIYNQTQYRLAASNTNMDQKASATWNQKEFHQTSIVWAKVSLKANRPLLLSPRGHFSDVLKKIRPWICRIELTNEGWGRPEC